MEERSQKRRSFVDVRRKSELFDTIFSEDPETSSSERKPKLSIDQYYASLSKERVQWKDILKVRNNQLKHYKNSFNYDTLQITANDAEIFLSEEDKIFLNDKPNYLGMMECASKYVKSLHFLKRYKSDVIEFYEEIIKQWEIDTDLLVEQLLQNNLCELCNQPNCIDSLHKFCTE